MQEGRQRSRILDVAASMALLMCCFLIAPEPGASQEASKAQPSSGEELYRASCVVCHGTRGMGGVGPRLAGNPVLLNDQAFWKVVHEGRHVMPPLKGVVTDQQMTDIRAWLKTLP